MLEISNIKMKRFFLVAKSMHKECLAYHRIVPEPDMLRNLPQDLKASKE